MKIKNVNVALLILAGLLFLSFAFFVAAQESSNNSNNVFLDSDQDGLTDQEEKAYGTDPHNPDTDGDSYSDGTEVKAGYDPLKPAPGDKVISVETPLAKSEDNPQETNLTNEMAQKILQIATNTDQNNQDITMEEIQNMIDESLNTQSSEEDLPQISLDEIKIKKQNYNKLSKEEAQQKRKEDFTKYIVAIYYILSSNSLEPITSFSDINKVISSFTTEIAYSLNSKSSSSLDNLVKASSNSLEQMKEVEVPEDLVDLHVKALRFALYAQNLKSSIDSKNDDPLNDIVKLSKLQTFVENLIAFTAEVEQKIQDYGIQYDDADVQKIMDKYGIELKNN